MYCNSLIELWKLIWDAEVEDYLKYNDQKRILKPSGFCYLGGVFQSVTYFRGGVPRCVTKCDREGRGQNSVTYSMDGPLGLPENDILQKSPAKIKFS